MSQRNSGYDRKERDFYQTPSWVTRALTPHIPSRINHIWECSAGDGMMAFELSKTHAVRQSDIYPTNNLHDVCDFLTSPIPPGVDAIITNPPYKLASEFCNHAINLMMLTNGFVAMLLRTDFDHAKTRQNLFKNCPVFSKKIVLTKRIVWFEGGGAPSFNHAWFCWDFNHTGAPTIAYES